MRADPAVFDTAVFWGNSQPGAVDQEDLVMMLEHTEIPVGQVMSRPTSTLLQAMTSKGSTSNVCLCYSVPNRGFFFFYRLSRSPANRGIQENNRFLSGNSGFVPQSKDLYLENR